MGKLRKDKNWRAVVDVGRERGSVEGNKKTKTKVGGKFGGKEKLSRW